MVEAPLSAFFVSTSGLCFSCLLSIFFQQVRVSKSLAKRAKRRLARAAQVRLMLRRPRKEGPTKAEEAQKKGQELAALADMGVGDLAAQKVKIDKEVTSPRKRCQRCWQQAP